MSGWKWKNEIFTIFEFQRKCLIFEEKKDEIWLNPVTKTPTPTKQSKKQRDNIKTPPKDQSLNLKKNSLKIKLHSLKFND